MSYKLFWIRHTVQFGDDLNVRVRACFSKNHTVNVLQELGWTRAESREAADLMEDHFRNRWLRMKTKRDSSLQAVGVCVSIGELALAAVKKFWKPFGRLNFKSVPDDVRLQDFFRAPKKQRQPSVCPEDPMQTEYSWHDAVWHGHEVVYYVDDKRHSYEAVECAPIEYKIVVKLKNGRPLFPVPFEYTVV